MNVLFVTVKFHAIIIVIMQRRRQRKKNSMRRAFKTAISDGPKHICVTCGCLFFLASVLLLSSVQGSLENCSILFNSIKYVDSQYICKTCYKNLKNNKLPERALANGLDFPKLPVCLKELSTLEERMVSPFVPFMQIRELQRYASNSQFGLKGTIVHIPVILNDIFEKNIASPFQPNVCNYV